VDLDYVGRLEERLEMLERNNTKVIYERDQLLQDQFRSRPFPGVKRIKEMKS
jgi:hypothetical protein